MAVPHQMVTPASNSVTIALVQDALPIARSLTAKDTFLTREEVMQLAASLQFNLKGGSRAELAEMPAGSTAGQMGFVDWLGHESADVKALRAPQVEAFMPAPAILKGTTWSADGVKTVHEPQWTGKQVVSWTLPRGMCFQKVLEDGVPPLEGGWVPPQPMSMLVAAAAALPQLEAAAEALAETETTRDGDDDDGEDGGDGKDGKDGKERLHMHRQLRAARDAEKALASVKSWMDDDNVVLVKDGELLAGRLCKQTVGRVSNGFVHVLWRQYGPWAAAKWVSDAQRLLNLWGLTDSLSISITDCVPPLETERQIDALVAAAMGEVDALLRTQAPDYVIELRTHKILQKLMRETGALVLKGMDPENGLLKIIKSGSKGNNTNLTQICAMLGPQSVFGARVRMRRSVAGLRTLFNFAPGDQRPEARGCVTNSLMRGLTPSEYYFHMMAAREGVVNTSINTAETGYSYNRMVQGEQSAAIMYDASVRAGNYQLIQLHYGDDDYDGSKLERVNMPAMLWSNAQLQRHLCLSPLPLVDRDGWTDDDATAVAEAAAYLKGEGALLEAARDMLRRMRMGLGDTLLTHFVLPINLETLVETARLTMRTPPTREAQEDAPAMARRILHLGRRTTQFLRFIIAMHDGLAARRDTAPPLPPTATLTERLKATLLRAGDDFTRYGDPSLVARAVYVLQLASGNILRRHNLDESALEWLLTRAAGMYRRGIVAPGEGVGALGASSMGEPSTQLTLNTFHSTGAENITNAPEGLPRFKQLINAQDTAATAKMTIRFKEPWASSEARVRAFAMGTARVLLAEVTAASDILLLEALPFAEALGALRPDAPAVAAPTAFVGLRRLLGLEAISLATASAGVLGAGFLAAQALDLEALSVDRVVSKVKKAVGKAVEAALLSTAELRSTVKPDALKKRRATGVSSGADPTATASRYLAAFRLNRDALYAKGLDIGSVEGAMRRVMAHEASVVASEAIHDDWVLFFRPLDVPGRVGMTAATWEALGDGDRRTIEKAVTEAIHDALVESLVIHGHPAVTQAVVRKERRHVVDSKTGALETKVTWVVDTEGSDLRAVALLPGVDIRATVTNNVREVNRVLGIEATVDMLQQQLHAVICTNGPYVDPRHMRMMALVMCRGGVFLPLNRHKLKKMGVAGLLQMASYEQTKEVFENGALFAETDPLAGAIEKMIVGQPFNVGTGAFDVRIMANTLVEPEAFVAPLGLQRPGKRKLEMAAALMAQAAKTERRKRARLLEAEEAGEAGQEERVPALPPRWKQAVAHGLVFTPASVDASSYLMPEGKRRREEDSAGAAGGGSGSGSGSKSKRARRSSIGSDEGVAPLAPQRGSRPSNEYEPSNPPHDGHVPEDLAAAIARVGVLAGQVRAAAKYSTPLELEARLGHLTEEGAFAPGIAGPTFRRLEAALESYKGWSDAPALVVAHAVPETVWQQCTHVIYDLEDGTEARTISAWHLAHEGVITKTHVSKTSLAQVDLAVAVPRAAEGPALSGMCVRVSLHTEEPIHTSRLPSKVLPTWVGIKQRKVYRKGAWAFTLTRVWGGATNVEAEARQMASVRALAGDGEAKDVTIYEVEVELAASGELLEQRGTSDASIAHALLARVRDFTGEASTFLPLDAPGAPDVSDALNALDALDAPHASNTMEMVEDDDMGVAPLLPRAPPVEESDGSDASEDSEDSWGSGDSDDEL